MVQVVTAPDGFPLAVQTGGDVARPALLLLQGQANSHAWWRRVRPALDRRFFTVTLDYRGTGGSRGPVGQWSTASFAADAAHVLQALGIGSAGVYGTSMGGRIAQLLAARTPQAVDRLVLACTSPGGRHAHERTAQVRRALAVRDPLAQRQVLHELFYTPAWPHGPAESTLLGDPTMTTAERRAHLRVSDEHDAWDELPRITAPTLVLHAEHDQMVPPENAPLIAARIPGSRLRVLARGRHAFFEEAADEVTPLVADFLEGGCP